MQNQAKAIVACDFFVSVTATFRILYVFVAMEVGSRRLLHFNVTSHPTAEWTIQQFREFLAFDHPYRFVIHDRDSIFSAGLDATLESMSVRFLRTPVRAPIANAFCETLIGTIRRECLDWAIPIGETHVRRILREWERTTIGADNTRPSDPGFRSRYKPRFRPASNDTSCQRVIVVSKPVFGGLHHEYGLEKEAA